MTVCCEKVFPKDPDDVRDYWIEWDDVLASVPAPPDVIVSHSAVLDPVPSGPDDLELFNVSHTSSEVIIWARKGVERHRYPVKVTITTAAGRTWQRTVEFAVREM